jgi:hypothetical protein
MNCSSTLIEEEFHKIVIRDKLVPILYGYSQKPVLKFNPSSTECHL